MTTYAYIRVSTDQQNVERQVLKMQEMGIELDNTYIDKASGKNLDRPAYQRMVDRLKPGDSIVLDSLDRLGRDYDAVTNEWRRITREIGVDIKVLDLQFFDSAAFRSMGDVGVLMEDMMLSLLSYVADTERKKMLQRQAEGIAVAKAKGVYTGRKPTDFDDSLIAEAQDALDKHGKAAAAKVLGVSRTTVYRMIEDGRLAA